MVRPHHEDRSRWLPLIRQAGDANLGTTLIRLAQAAAALHVEALNNASSDMPPSTADAAAPFPQERRSNGLDPSAAAPAPAGPSHKEVDR